MKIYLLFAILISFTFKSHSQTKTIHVYVALCDNEFQGIVPVPERIGNGKQPNSNLYWGAGYGVKTFFKVKTKDWQLVEQRKSSNPFVLDQLLFKHATKDTYLLAEAYDGEQIKSCIEDFLKVSNGQQPQQITYKGKQLSFGGNADLVAYIGHDGLMDFSVSVDYQPLTTPKKDVIILACYSREFFTPQIKKAQANPLLWTTHLMAPEAYTLKAALDGWLLDETGQQIDERAAQAYHKYQKCGIKGARNLFTTGFKN